MKIKTILLENKKSIKFRETFQLPVYSNPPILPLGNKDYLQSNASVSFFPKNVLIL